MGVRVVLVHGGGPEINDMMARVGKEAVFVDAFFNKEDYWFDRLKPSGKQIHDRIAFVTLFKNLLQNEDFRRRFVDAFCIMGGSVFEKERSIAIINELAERVEPAMNMENQGWNFNNTASSVKNSLNNRLSTAIRALRNSDYMNLYNTEPQQAKLSSDTEGARLFINSQVVPTGEFDGKLFQPVTLRAEAPAGYAFKAWVDGAGHSYSTYPEMRMPTGDDVTLTATFRKLTANETEKQNMTPIRINEVSGANDTYIDEYFKKGDWVELYNTTSEPIDVEGMYLTDNINKPTKYMISKENTKAQTVIPAHGYLVIWCDNKRATTDNGLHAGFKISDDGGTMMLSAADRSWSDVITYPAHDARTTIGRYPDGATTVYAMNVVTIGKSNVYSSYATVVPQDVIPTGAETMATAGNLRLVYGADVLLVKSSTEGTATVEVFRADGMQVAETTVEVAGGSGRVSVADLPSGFYVARVTDAQGGKSSCRFVK